LPVTISLVIPDIRTFNLIHTSTRTRTDSTGLFCRELGIYLT
jgi:hypothetical protein